MSHTLLLVDDSVTIQRVIELTFADEDVKVVPVSSGEHAIALIDQAPPDIVLADVGMPGTNGYEVARHIRKQPRLAKIPVVLLSGAFEPVDEAKAAEVGCDGILAKPFEPQLVIEKVRELLQRSTGHAGYPSENTAARPVSTPIPPAAAAAAPLDDYFDRLDAAFATLTAAGSPAAAPRAVPPSPRIVEDVPEPVMTPRAADESLPTLADAFAALLAAEQGSPDAKSAAVWPAGAKLRGGDLDAQAIDDIVDRVLARLSDRVAPRGIRSLVEDIAERVVREEIERLKGSIQ